MSPEAWLRLLGAAVEAIPALRDALRMIFAVEPTPEARRIREILGEESESERAARELREAAREGDD